MSGGTPALKKLTLTVDEEVIERARRYSALHDTSISRLVTRYLARLSANEERTLAPAVQRLVGILPPDVDPSEYLRHLEDKHRP